MDLLPLGVLGERVGGHHFPMAKIMPYLRSCALFVAISTLVPNCLEKKGKVSVNIFYILPFGVGL